MNNPIAVFDSGVGGISVLHALYRTMPEDSYVYYADVKNAPYGAKSTEEINRCVDEAVRFLSGYSIKALVIACNTATSAAVGKVRKSYPFPVIGMEPAIKPALHRHPGTNILTLATEKTLDETKYNRLRNQLDREGKVTGIAMNRLVEFAENFEFTSENVMRYIRWKLAHLDLTSFSAVVLGCTHFIYFKPALASFFSSQVHFYDGVNGTVRQLVRSVQPAKTGSKSKTRLFLSGLEADREFLDPYLDHLGGKTFQAFRFSET